MSSPARSFSSSAAKCGVPPGPVLAKVSPPGFCRTSASSPAMSRTGRPGPHHQQGGHAGDHPDRHQVPPRIVGEVGDQADIHRDRAGRTERQGEAVRHRLGHRVDADRAAGPRAVLHHDLLAEQRRQRLRHDPRRGIDRPARREGHDQLERPVRKAILHALGPCRERRHSQRESRAPPEIPLPCPGLPAAE